MSRRLPVPRHDFVGREAVGRGRVDARLAWIVVISLTILCLLLAAGAFLWAHEHQRTQQESTRGLSAR